MIFSESLNQETEKMMELFLKFSDVRTISLDDFFRFREEAIREAGASPSSRNAEQASRESNQALKGHDEGVLPDSERKEPERQNPDQGEAELLAAMKAMEG